METVIYYAVKHTFFINVKVKNKTSKERNMEPEQGLLISYFAGKHFPSPLSSETCPWESVSFLRQNNWEKRGMKRDQTQAICSFP